MPRILVTDQIAEDGVAVLRREAEVDVRLKPSPEGLLALIGDYDALVVRPDAKVRRLDLSRTVLPLTR